MNLEPIRDERGDAPPGDWSARWLRAGLVTLDQARVVERRLGPSEPDHSALQGLVEVGVLTPSQVAVLRRLRLNGAGGGPRTAESSHVADRQGAGPRGRATSRLSLDAGRLGVVLAALAFAGLAWALAGLASDLVAPQRQQVGLELADGMRLLASVLGLIGGRRMYRGSQDGKPMALMGILLYAAVTLAAGFRKLSDPWVVAQLASCAALYALTVSSRFGSPRSADVEADAVGERALSTGRVSPAQV
jgi:hypothetical protein